MKQKKSGIKYKMGKIVKERIERRGRARNWRGYRGGRRDLE